MDSPADPELARLATLGRMTAGVLHDLRNYFMVVDLTLSKAEAGLRDGTARVHITRARGEVDRAAALAALLTRRVQGDEPRPAPVDLGRVVREASHLVVRLLPRGVELTLDVDEDLPPVEGVSAELDRLVMNLVVDAAEAMPQGGRVRVSVRAGGPAAVRLEVVHSGAARSDGFGLALARDVVARHGALLRHGASPSGGGRVLVLFGRC